MARLAPSLVDFRSQINARAPHRSKASDGWIGDAAHAARSNKHNPDSAGWVRAFDLTHDPAGGEDNWVTREQLRASRDPRIGVCISMGQIFSSTATSARPAWTWGPYTGTNGHYKHLHLDVMSGELGLRPGLWNLSRDLGAPVRPPIDFNPPEEDDMPLTDAEIERVAARAAEHVWGVANGGYTVKTQVHRILERVDLADPRQVSILNGVVTLLGRNGSVDVDESQLAAELAPLLNSAVRSLSSEDLARIAVTVSDEQDARARARLAKEDTP